MGRSLKGVISGMEEYIELPAFNSMAEALTRSQWDIPLSWYIAATDVVDSTGAIEEGKYRNVNISQSSIAINEDCDVLSFFMVNLARKARFAIVIV